MYLAVPIWPQEILNRRRDRFVGHLNWSQIFVSHDPDSIRYRRAYPHPIMRIPGKPVTRWINANLRWSIGAPRSELWKRTHRTNHRPAPILSANERSTPLKMYDSFVAASPALQSCVRSDVDDWPVTAQAERCASLKNTSRNI